MRWSTKTTAGFYDEQKGEHDAPWVLLYVVYDVRFSGFPSVRLSDELKARQLDRKERLFTKREEPKKVRTATYFLRSPVPVMLRIPSRRVGVILLQVSALSHCSLKRLLSVHCSMEEG
jgi:hypothetical protein